MTAVDDVPTTKGSDAAAAGSAPDTPPVPPAARRRLPRIAELRTVLRFRRPTLDPVERRLESALTIADLRRVAQRVTPRAVFDYVDGAADAEATARKNLAAFETTEFLPELLHSVVDPDISTTLLGDRIALPLVFAPTGYTRLMHEAGETAAARVAARVGIPYVLSTVGTSTIEEVTTAAPGGNNWFQLYLTNSEALNAELVERALQAGVRTIALTIDSAVGGRRLKDLRNGLTIPPSLTARTFLDMARYPSWWIDKLTTAPVEFASVRDFPGVSYSEVAGLLFDPGIDYDDLAWLRSRWPGNLLVKGIVNPEDARRVVAAGADGVVVSNHGGRQLDRSPATLDVLPAVREAVGESTTVLLDSGVRNGQDIIAAVALGADAVLVGRAYLYGLMAGGERGVDRAAEILRSEYQRALQLLGLDATAKIGPQHVLRSERASG
ncbi:alpha-hydroxy acid oxidase [Amnibacterium sp. CER49]|uniref:alpha-hydroxy acid oxidase n=1 Tax=Amnibacterium sp. CER49 TaxID=3039161 RepID=UPI00244BA68C|nr:alpha-hydroxy acid oxidase [Amnibacterium sp. CER49]MDH2445155.1 alpha-hydroxy acid oxidase [Amnibacterium sp. CER49]